MSSWWSCEAKQYDPETLKGFGGGREIIEASSPKEARKKFQDIRKSFKKNKSFARLLLEVYGFYGPFKSQEMARNIRCRYVRKIKRHSL